MQVGAIVQARMSSRRFPGKVLANLGSQPALELLLERLRSAERFTRIVIATSNRQEDDRIEQFCRERRLLCFRGSLDNVAKRILLAARASELDVIVRVNGDSPFLDQRLIDEGIENIISKDYDVVTNVFPRSFPPGQSVEIVKTTCLEEAVSAMREPYDKEHVTSWIYRNREKFSIYSFSPDKPITHPAFTLDTKEDLIFLERILQKMTGPQWLYSWEEITLIAQEVSC